MKAEAQRIAIAEACGWTDVAERYESNGWDFTGLHPLHTPHSNRHFVPDYLSDLNAMHEAEKVLNTDQQLRYGNDLIDVCDRDRPKAANTFNLFRATAAQRAEALLRTLEKWEDGK